jgi:hypothetical protein
MGYPYESKPVQGRGNLDSSEFLVPNSEEKERQKRIIDMHETLLVETSIR